MLPYTVARVAASRHAANYRRGDEPRNRCARRASRIVELCRAVDQDRTGWIAVAEPFIRDVFASIVSRAADGIDGPRTVAELVHDAGRAFQAI